MRLFIVVLLVLFFSCGEEQKTYSLNNTQLKGKVIRVLDGDTVDIEVGSEKKRIRLADIDAPEYDQTFGEQSKKYTTNYLLNKVVIVFIKNKDRYGRFVGTIYYTDTIGNFKRDVNFNLLIVSDGYAWWCPAYSKNENFKKMQELAKAQHLGLWNTQEEDGPEAPWEFRKRVRLNSDG